MEGVPKSCVKLKKTAVSHVTAAKEIALSPVDSNKQSCRMPLTILSPMSHVKFKKSHVELKSCRHVKFSGLDLYTGSEM